MKTHGPVGPAIETEWGTEADWQQFYSLLNSVKGIKGHQSHYLHPSK